LGRHPTQGQAQKHAQQGDSQALQATLQGDDRMTKEEKLSKLLETMDIPAMRKETIHLRSTLRWLNRNLRIKNAGKPETTEALALIKELMRGQ